MNETLSTSLFGNWLNIENLIIALLGSLVGVIVNRQIGKRKERNDRAFYMFQRYHSEMMISARSKTWDYLSLEFHKSPKPFQSWFNKEENLSFEFYGDFVKVIYFWLELSIMAEKKLINKNLTCKLLGYQWLHWKNALKQLAQLTINHKTDIPEWIVIFDEHNMTWLERDITIEEIF